MKFILQLTFLLIYGVAISQNNLLDSSTWIEGSGSVPSFEQYGASYKNIRETGIGPFNATVLYWKCIPDDLSTSDGGWNTDYYPMDHTKMYRFTVWIKRTNSLDGNTYFGFNAIDANDQMASLKADDSVNSNPYFISQALPSINEWYLLVGFVYGSGMNSSSQTGGIYNTSGEKVADLYDYKFTDMAVSLRHRVYLKDSNALDNQYYYAPTIYEINGQEPTIAQILTPPSQGTSSVWDHDGTTISYTNGNVGIGTNVPGTWKLAVNGNIRAKEIKVETDWADYVFENGYDLPSLEEVEKHIHEKGHLINMPSAKEVKENGIQLGAMNKLLLEKVEELTLYTIRQQKEIQSLKRANESLKFLATKLLKLEERMEKLEKK